jgi:hypothetical protein
MGRFSSEVYPATSEPAGLGMPYDCSRGNLIVNALLRGDFLSIIPQSASGLKRVQVAYQRKGCVEKVFLGEQPMFPRVSQIYGMLGWMFTL